MSKLLRDPYLTVRVKRLLMLTALRPCLEYAAEVLAPNTAQSRALESVQLKAARMILGCPTLTSSEAVRGDLMLPLLSSRRDIARLKWQHRVHHMSSSSLEHQVYSRAAPCATRGRKRCMFGQVCDKVWRSLPILPQDSLSLHRSAFISSVTSAVYERDATDFSRALSTKPRLGIYNRVNEGPGVKQYLLRSSGRHQAAQIRFQFRSGTSMLQHHCSRFRNSHHADDEEEENSRCQLCQGEDTVESVQHVLFQCSAYAHIRDPFMSALLQLVGAGNFNVFRSLSFEDQLVAFLRDDFMSSASAHISAVQRLSDSFLVDVVAFRQRSLASLSSPD